MILFKVSLQLSTQRTKVGNTFCLERALIDCTSRTTIQARKKERVSGRVRRKAKAEKIAKGTSETDSCGMFELVNCFALVCNITKNRMQSMR